MFKTSIEQIDVVKANTAAFMALSRIAFSSVERLASVNLDAARVALEVSVTASSAWAQTKDVNELQNLWSPLTGPATQNITNYLRHVQEIAAQTQEETTKLMTSYLATLTAGATAGTALAAGSDLFTNFAQQMTSLAEANVKAAGDAARQMTTPEAQSGRKTA
jgi:phasin family protein